MKRETIIGLSAGVFFVMILIALFTQNPVQDASLDVLHEIRTADAFKQAAIPGVNCPLPSRQGAGQLAYPYQGQGFQQIATIPAGATPGATPIAADQKAPELIKYMGVEVIPVGGGKVKITGVMGNSWADKAGLQPGDILLSFNAQPINSLEEFKTMLASAPSEKDYKITYLRGARKKKGIIFIGEGEMEGFLPIKQPK